MTNQCRRGLLLIVVLLSLGILAAAASAALPKKGGTYVGTVHGNTVTLKISKRTPLKGKYTYDCGADGGPVGAYTKVNIKPDGRFSGHTKAGFGGDVDSLRGRFTSGKRARARFRLTICNGRGGTLTLKRQ
jgi:hypothetical protein